MKDHPGEDDKWWYSCCNTVGQSMLFAADWKGSVYMFRQYMVTSSYSTTQSRKDASKDYRVSIFNF